jgi:hypothetical protein
LSPTSALSTAPSESKHQAGMTSARLMAMSLPAPTALLWDHSHHAPYSAAGITTIHARRSALRCSASATAAPTTTASPVE